MPEQQIATQIKITLAMAEAIKALGSVPSGHLYNQVMGRMTLDQYSRIIADIERCKMIKIENHLITWIGD